MRSTVLTILAAGCVHNTVQLKPDAPAWADYDAVRASAQCAVEQVYGPSIAADIAEVSVEARAGPVLQNYDIVTRIIYLSSDEVSALTSPLLHELFEHALPHILHHQIGANRNHDSSWHGVALYLGGLAAQCRKTTHKVSE